jgi:nucleoside-diphosphate-sugar epimerase
VHKKILITGGAGLIGSYVTEKLVLAGHEVTVIDDLTRGLVSNVPDGCRHVIEPVANLRTLRLGCFDIMVHLASFMYGIGYSAKNHGILYQKNIDMNHSIIQYLECCPPERFVFISSSCVYPDDGPQVIHESVPLEDYPEVANMGYAFAKMHMEDCLRMAHWFQGFELSIIRPLNIYGERYRWAGDLSQAVPMLVDKVMTNDMVEVWGSGEQRRNYVHASDAAEIIKLVALVKTPIPLLNIGSRETISMNELTKKIATIAKRSIMIRNNLEKPEGRFIKCNDDTLVRQYFPDYKYKVSLNEGLRRMTSWWYAGKNE